MEKIRTLIDNPNAIDEAYIRQELASDKLVILQYAEPLYSTSTLDKINAICSSTDSDFVVRFYGHYGLEFDANLIKRIQNVKGLSLDCIQNVKHIDALKELPNLERVSLGVFYQEDKEVLSYESFKSVKELYIYDTHNKALNLEHLSDYKSLERLIVCGHTKNINSIGTLSKLEWLSLNSVSKVPLTFVNCLKKLKTLKIILGGRTDINEIEENNIEHLEITWVRAFSDLSALRNFKSLKTLLVQDQLQLKELHLPYLPKLEELKVINCKGLMSLTGLDNLPSLKEIRIARTALDYQSFIKQPLPASLKTFAFYTWKIKQDAIIKVDLDNRGFKEF